MENPCDAIVNGIVADLKKKGFSDAEIEMAIVAAKKHYEAYFGTPKKSKNEEVKE